TLASGLDGLDAGDAERRLAAHGPNRLPAQRGRSALRRFLIQFHDVLIYLLLGAGMITVALGHWVDSAVIFGVVVINAFIGFVQEGKAERAMDAIRHMLSHRAAVLRAGHYRELPAEELVPGDIVLLQAGDRVPADLRLLRTRELRVEEAALTGESVPTEKNTGPVAERAEIGDRTGMAFSGTMVSYGQGTGVVVATGGHTEIGRISALLSGVQTISTPLLRQMARFGRALTVAIIALATATFAVGVLLRGASMEEMFLAAVALAVAAVPEGLPAVITITLAIGMQRMAGRNVIIRRLPAVETLGSVTVICSDKTGTLTRNEMTVREIATGSGALEVGGAGYAPHGTFTLHERVVEPSGIPDLVELLRAAVLCNDAALEERDDGWIAHGDPMEAALLAAGLKAGLQRDFECEARPRVDSIPFDSRHRFMATLHHDHAGHAFIYVKGAPERILAMCSHQRQASEDRPLNPGHWHALADTMAADGQRVLAMAFMPADAGRRELRFEDAQSGLSLLGLTGFIDPPRDEAMRAVTQCKSAGVGVKMITGDHAVTARAIGRQLGIGDGERVLTGRQLEIMDDDALRSAVRDTDVFARASPEHKLRLVTALQANGEVAAMTGDGVNDSPALKRADVGVAMGMKGTEAAKEAAEMVLTDDNFASIVAGIEEGRTVYDNIKKSILFILPTNAAEAAVVVAAIALGYLLPITPVQILWVNMITAVTLALALAFEPAETDIMSRPPRPAHEPLLSRFLVWRITLVSLALTAAVSGLFLWSQSAGASLNEARTVAVNTLVAGEIGYLLSSRFITASSLRPAALTGNPYVLVTIALVSAFQLLFTYAPPMQYLFHTAPIGLLDWARIAGAAAAVLLVVEGEKLLLRRRRTRAGGV
ncbi:MAG: cation-transporting P-type ATPase, partial [Gammaproteobacteria bacterium]